MIDDGMVAVYRMADKEVQRPGNNDQRFQALLRIRAFAKDHLTLSCDHQWDGPRVAFGECVSVGTCSRCGEAAIDLQLLGAETPQRAETPAPHSETSGSCAVGNFDSKTPAELAPVQRETETAEPIAESMELL